MSKSILFLLIVQILTFPLSSTTTTIEFKLEGDNKKCSVKELGMSILSDGVIKDNIIVDMQFNSLTKDIFFVIGNHIYRNIYEENDQKYYPMKDKELDENYCGINFSDTALVNGEIVPHPREVEYDVDSADYEGHVVARISADKENKSQQETALERQYIVKGSKINKHQVVVSYLEKGFIHVCNINANKINKEIMLMTGLILYASKKTISKAEQKEMRKQEKEKINAQLKKLKEDCFKKNICEGYLLSYHRELLYKCKELVEKREIHFKASSGDKEDPTDRIIL